MPRLYSSLKAKDYQSTVSLTFSSSQVGKLKAHNYLETSIQVTKTDFFFNIQQY